MRKKLSVALLAIYGVFIAALGFHITGAFFTDSANSTSNTFAAAATFPTATPSGHLVISEIQTATSGAVTSDFIELYNPTNSDVNLNGHRLVKRTNSGSTDDQIKAFDSSDIVPAHGYYLWASTDGGYSDTIGANAETAENIADDNSIALRNGPVDSGSIVDAVAWGSHTGSPLVEGSAFTPNPTNTQSIERKALSTSDSTTMSTGGTDENKGNGFDLGNNASDFVLRASPQPQSGGTEQP